jgi:hypothetical protein
MPFHAMSGYPYKETEHFPDTDTALDYRLTWNDRIETGNEMQSYRFNYRPRQAEPITPAATSH